MSDDAPRERLRAALSRFVSGGHEADAEIDDGRLQAWISEGGATILRDNLERSFQAAGPASAEIEDLRRQVLDQSLALLTGDSLLSPPADQLADVTLEALICETGRPTLAVRNGTVSADDPHVGSWLGDLVQARNALRPLIEATGRIDVAGAGRPEHRGSGVLVARNLLLTNRHVANDFSSQLICKTKCRPSVIFGDDGSDDSQRFAITEIVRTGSITPGRKLYPFELDLAWVAIEPRNAYGNEPPAPVALKDGPAGTTGQAIAVVGFPGAPEWKDKASRVAVLTRRLFNLGYGRKYLSPGRIIEHRDQICDKGRNWIIRHDASTLGGNSGSAVIELGTNRVIGVHAAGCYGAYNSAFDLAVVERQIAAEPSLVACRPALWSALTT